MPTRVPRYLSNTEKNLKIGVSNYSEDKVSLEVIGLVGIGSTTPTDILDVQGTTKSKGLNITGVSTFAGAVDLNAGLDIDGQLDVDELVVAGVSTFNSRIDLNAGLDIDGQLDVDELVVAGVSTFSNAVDINSTLDVDGDTQLDDLTVAGFATFTSNASFAGNVSIAGTLTYEDVTNIDAIGIITAGNGLRITQGGINVTAGISTFGGNINANGDITGDNDTNITGINSIFLHKEIIHIGDEDTTITFNEDRTTLAAGGVARLIASSAGGFGGVIISGDLQDSGSNFNINSDSGAATFKTLNITTGVSTFAGNINANGNIIGDTATNISGINSVTATTFFGDGSGLENTGATLSAASGSQRLVLTSLTSGTMTSAATDADLSFNATSNLLSAGKLNVTGLTTISNLKVDSGIVTAASGIATYNGDLVIGTPSAGFKSGAFSINTTDKTKDSINELNFILGKLVPDPPDTINGASFTLSGLGNGRLCAGFTPVNNTGGSHAVAAGRQYSRNTDSTITSNTLTEFGPGDSETVTGFVNAVGVGTTTLTVGVNNGTFDKLVISNNEDASNSSRNPGITSQFYEIYDARLLNAASPDGFNKAFISQGISTTTSAFWYEDPSTVSAPVISFSPVTYPASPTLSYSSGIPHYTQASANAFTYALGVENASGDMYTQNTFVSSDGQTSGFQNPGSKSYTNFTGGTNPPARNYGVGAAVTTQISQQPRDLHLTATSNVFTSFDASTPYGSHNNQRVGFTTDVNIMGTTARTNQIDEDNILITSLGTGSGNATRVNAGSTGDNPSPVFTAWGGGSAGSIATYEAAVRGAVLRHDQTDYSDGSYLPVGPDYSGSRSGTQYFQIELIRSNVSEFRISYTGSAAGCFVCMPQNSAWTTSLSGVNGWADMFQAYKGSGIPTSAEPGCSSGGLMDNDGGTFTCVFGTESSSNDTGNRILIRWKLTSGQSITAMSFTST